MVIIADEMSSSRASPPADTKTLRPDDAQRLSGSPSLVSPSDLVGPSPVTSNGTETTEIEDVESEEVKQSAQRGTEEPQVRSPWTLLNMSEDGTLTT